MRRKLCFFGMCLGQGAMLQRYNKWCFDSYLLFVRASLVTDGSKVTEYNRNTSTEIRDEAFGLRTTPRIKCYIVVCSQANPWIRNDWTSAHKCAGWCICYSFKVLKEMESSSIVLQMPQLCQPVCFMRKSWYSDTLKQNASDSQIQLRFRRI